MEGIVNFHADIIIYGNTPAEHHTDAIGAPTNTDKTNMIDQCGSPDFDEEEVRRFLQDGSINTKFTFSYGESKK